MLRNVTHRILLVSSSALLLILSFPSAHLWICAWIGLLPLFWALEQASLPGALLLGYLAGLLFWAGILYWLVHVTLAGTILLILYLGLYWSVFAAGVCLLQRRRLQPAQALVVIPSLWVTLEYLRSDLFTGFPWALAGYSQYQNRWMIQIAELSGSYGVSFLLIVVNLALYGALTESGAFFSGARARKGNAAACIKWLLPALLCVAAAAGYGAQRLHSLRPQAGQPAAKIAVVQGNIAQELKWDPSAKGYILEQYRQLTLSAAAGSPQLIVWPEAASPGLVGDDVEVEQALSQLARQVRIPLLIGAVTYRHRDYFNSALLFDRQGSVAGIYDKLHRVPFGEYIPLRKLLPFLETIVPIGEVTAGRAHTVFTHDDNGPALRYGVLICFEDLFPELSRQLVQGGADFLINITNDAWYKKTSAPYQHLQASVFRAVENRIGVVRAANTGISAFIDPTGRVVSTVQQATAPFSPLFIPGYKTGMVQLRQGGYTLYSRYGDWWAAVCCLVSLLTGLWLLWPRLRRNKE